MAGTVTMSVTVDGRTPSTFDSKLNNYLVVNSGVTQVTAKVPYGWTGEINTLYLYLRKHKIKGETSDKIYYWFLKVNQTTKGPATLTATTNIYSFLDGVHQFSIGVGRSDWTSPVDASPTPISGARVQNLTSITFFRVSLSYTPVTNFETYLIYPYYQNTVFLGNSRKIIFRVDGNGTVGNIRVSYYIDSTDEFKQYYYSMSKNLFELKQYDITWEDFDPSLDSLHGTLYGVFNTPDKGVLNDIQVEIRSSSHSYISDEDPTLSYKDPTKYLAIKNAIPYKTEVTQLKTLSDSIASSYQKVTDDLSLSQYPDITIGDKIEALPFYQLLSYWKDFYNSLKEKFPKSFTYDLSEIYLPQGGEKIEAESLDTPPSSTVNGNFFNSLLWILKNLL